VNRLIGEIKNIRSLERLNLIECKVGQQTVKVLILEMNISLKPGSKVELLIKPTAISVSDKNCAFENVLKGRVVDIQNGKILSNITAEVEGFEMECIMLKEYAGFKDEVYLFFKANDVAIGKVLE